MENAGVLFYGETWVSLAENLYISTRRQAAKNKDEEQKLEREIDQARLLTSKGYTVYLVPEVGSGKHYDALVDGEPVELKCITGGERALRQRFKESREQAQNIFLMVQNKEASLQIIRNTLKGEIIQHGYKGGIIYVYVNGKFIQWSVDKDLC